MCISKIVAIAGLVCGLQSAVLAADAPDKILVDGTILTLSSNSAVAQAIALSGSQTIAVGTNSMIKKMAGPRTKVISLGGRTVIPGLIDTHLHAIRGGQTYQSETYWYDAKTLQSGLSELRHSAEKKGPGKWVTVAGSWSPEQFAEKRAPTVQDLNEALPQNPAYVPYLYDYAKQSRAEQAQSARAALDAGLVVAGGTYSTRIGEYNAWRAIESQVTGLAIGGSVQRRKALNLTRMQALRLYTSSAAWISFDEMSRGSLEVGKQADLAVLDQPYLTIPMERIHTLKSLFTMVGGVVVQTDPSFQKME